MLAHYWAHPLTRKKASPYDWRQPGVCYGLVCYVTFPTSSPPPSESPACGIQATAHSGYAGDLQTRKCRHALCIRITKCRHTCRGDGARQSSATQGSYQGTVLQRGSGGPGGTWGTVVMHDGDGPATPTHDFQDTVIQHPTLRKPAAPRAFGRGSPLPTTPVPSAATVALLPTVPLQTVHCTVRRSK